MYIVHALDQWRLHKLLGIKWYHTMWWYHHGQKNDVRRKTEQPHLSATVQAWRLSLFSHIVRMSDESDAKQILTASPLENRRRPPGRYRTTWMKTTQQDLKSINLSLNEAIDVAQNRPRLVLCTHSGACQKWMNEWIYTSGFMSRWTTPLEWRKLMADTSFLVMLLASVSVNCFLRRIRSSNSPPVNNSITTYTCSWQHDRQHS